MKTTRCQHSTEVDRAAGLGNGVKVMGIKERRIPSPGTGQKVFARRARQPQPGWQAAHHVAGLRPGDAVSWERKGEGGPLSPRSRPADDVRRGVKCPATDHHVGLDKCAA